MAETTLPKSKRLRSGDWVQVRSKEEILATLDSNGRLDQMPFMPEMLRFCGMKLRVSKRAHKTCDPALGIEGRKMAGTVHLENIRCDGQAHDGCQAHCLIFWKEAWLRPLSTGRDSPLQHIRERRLGCHEADIVRNVRATSSDGDALYVCQNTQVKYATSPLPWWDIRQYLEDYSSGNVRLSQLAAAFTFFIWKTVAEAGLGFGTPMRVVYNAFQRVIGGFPYPSGHPEVPKGVATPTCRLDLKAGDTIRVRSFPDILKTLDGTWRNRGMYFDSEMVPFTEKTYQVQQRLERIIDERTGKMVHFKTDAVVLENVVCEARYAKCRRFCPRGIYPFWREIWLERTGHGSSEDCR